jgi:hypothetical protein
LVRANDFVADNLEAEADMMPPWTKFQAGIWRDVAKDLRASESIKMVRVWEESEPQGISHAPSCLLFGLVGGKPLIQVARICYRYVFPYFAGGIVFAGLVSGAFSRPTVWRGAILLLPVIVLGYLYSLSRTVAVPPAPTSPDAAQ